MTDTIQPTDQAGFPFGDRTDFADADRGFIAALTPGVVTAADGRVVWDNDKFSFLEADCPDTANPSLWRQSQLTALQGLYEVTDGIYQVRGLDLSNMTMVEGDRGVIVIDPLISKETASAALGLYRLHRGQRPVTGVIYTHSHVDHFGGVEGVLTEDVPILAPQGFLEHAVAENVYAGVAMLRRGSYHTGYSLPAGPTGLIGTGLGQTASTGTITLIAPTIDITRTGQEETIDGVRMIFQLTPGTEAPSEMNFLFPDRRALCLAENATHNLHNILTLRGAVVRDARIWSRYLNEAGLLFVDQTDVAFASHHWPTWGSERVATYLSQQRDLYAYLHDQTLRLLNQGHTGIEIAEMIQLPPALEDSWHTMATTVRSATTSRPSTSTTWAGSTAIPLTCGNSRPPRPASGTSSAWAAPPPPSPRPVTTLPPVICGSRSSCSTMSSLRTPPTPRPRTTWPTPTSGSATVRRTVPGGTST